MLKANEWDLVKRQFDALTHDESAGAQSIEEIFDVEFRRRFTELINQTALLNSTKYNSPRHRNVCECDVCFWPKADMRVCTRPPSGECGQRLFRPGLYNSRQHSAGNDGAHDHQNRREINVHRLSERSLLDFLVHFDLTRRKFLFEPHSCFYGFDIKLITRTKLS